MAQTETLDPVPKVGRERLYPSLTNPNCLGLAQTAGIVSTLAQQAGAAES
jgi:hypothetical protein